MEKEVAIKSSLGRLLSAARDNNANTFVIWQFLKSLSAEWREQTQFEVNMLNDLDDRLFQDCLIIMRAVREKELAVVANHKGNLQFALNIY